MIARGILPSAASAEHALNAQTVNAFDMATFGPQADDFGKTLQARIVQPVLEAFQVRMQRIGQLADQVTADPSLANQQVGKELAKLTGSLIYSLRGYTTSGELAPLQTAVADLLCVNLDDLIRYERTLHEHVFSPYLQGTLNRRDYEFVGGIKKTIDTHMGGLEEICRVIHLAPTLEFPPSDAEFLIRQIYGGATHLEKAHYLATCAWALYAASAAGARQHAVADDCELRPYDEVYNDIERFGPRLLLQYIIDGDALRVVVDTGADTTPETMLGRSYFIQWFINSLFTNYSFGINTSNWGRDKAASTLPHTSDDPGRRW